MSDQPAKLELPARFRRNSHMVKAAGYDESALALIDLMRERLGLADFSASHILDVGCGTRFTAAMINHGVPVGSYTGVDVDRDIIDFLQQHATPLDNRFRYAHWPVHNALYHPDGLPMAQQTRLPVTGTFDVIWLFSVFTHLNPEDAAAMLRLLRQYAAPKGRLIFTCRLSDDIDTFVDRVPDQPLLRAVFSRRYMKQLIEEGGWMVEGLYEKDPRDFVRSHYVCVPA